MFEENLVAGITKSLGELEKQGSLVITETTLGPISEQVVSKVKETYAGGVVSPEELLGICSVLFHAVDDEKFFDWEMPTLCGYKASEIRDITERLRNSINT